MAADAWGKIKTIFQDIALPALFFLAFVYEEGLFGATFVNVFSIICYVLIGIATLLTIISAVNYLVKNRQILKSDKGE